MSETKKTESGQTDDVSVDTDTTDTTIEVKHTPEELTKRVVELSAENKKRREKEAAVRKQLAEAEAKTKALEEAKLQADGKVQELLEKTRKELEAEREQNKQMKSSFAYRAVTQEVKTEAIKAGCINADKLIKLAAAEGMLGDLEVDTDFNVSQDSVKTLLEKARKENPFLFGKEAPGVRDVKPGTVKADEKPVVAKTVSENAFKLAELMAKR